MTQKEAMVIVWKSRRFDSLLNDWFFASSKEDMVKACKLYKSIRGQSAFENIRRDLIENLEKAFYTIVNTRTKEVSYYAIDTEKLSLRHWMINHLDVSDVYDTYEGYVKTVEGVVQ